MNTRQRIFGGIFWLVLLVGFPLMAQLVEKLPNRLFAEFPQAEIRNFGVGNYGFNGLANSYNPAYRDHNPNVSILIGGVFNTSASRSGSLVLTGVTGAAIENEPAFLPSLAAVLTVRPFQVLVKYSPEYSLGQRRNDLRDSLHFGSLAVGIQQEEINIRKQNLLLALSMQASPQWTFTLGAATSQFLYRWEIDHAQPIEFSTGLFSTLQYLFSMEYSPEENLRSYLLFKTQKAAIALDEAVFDNGSIRIALAPASVSYFGRVGYGLQYSVLSKIKFSLEMRHEYLEVSDTSFSALAAGIDEKHLWNNELIAGLNIRALKNLELGALYSHFIKYDNTISIGYQPLSSSSTNQPGFATIRQPGAWVFSFEYFFNDFMLRGVFNITHSDYQDGERRILSDRAQFMAIELGHHFQL